MGNYENLKQSITEVIRNNGNQEITGAVLQSALLTIISTVGANATFAGIATPTTNPGTPDGPVFYLASESGTYTNFNAIELQDGLSILTWNGSWSAQQIFSIDDVPTAGSDNLVRSGGVYAKIKSLEDAGYLFAGIATPTTNPGTPDQNVFYLAFESGTYSNFNAIELQNGLSVLILNGSSWVSHQIFSIDKEPTEGSDNLIKSGGVFNNIGAIDISELNATENPHTLATYEDLTSALNALPASYRKGGMSVKFVQSSDNKYVQYRLLTQIFINHINNWEEINSVKATTSSEESDLDISDDQGNVLARFANGHIQVKNFDSVDNNENISAILRNVGITDIPVFNEEEDYEIGDIVRYNKLIYKFTSAHEAGEWDSSEVEETDIISELDIKHPVAIETASSDIDLDISDENGNVLVKFSGGHIQTKNFNSENINQQDNVKSKYLIPAGTVALWDFCRTEDYLIDIVSGHTLTPVNVTKDSAKGVYFNGSTSYMEIKNINVGNLDVSKYGEEVTVMALVNPSALNNSYIAGMWTENNNNPHREYGLFINLPTYGGSRKVIGHISRTGGASPGLPFSRDYSASGRSVVIGRDSFIGMTYDGHVAKSYLDGLTDSYIRYTELGAPTGQSLTYNKNPYVFNLGLNKMSKADFNVGANLLTGGMSNFYNGYISKLIIVARALSEKEMADMAYFYCKNAVFATFPNVESSNETIEAYQGGFKTRTSVGGVITDNLSSANSVKNIKSTTESSLYISPSEETTALAYIESEYVYLSQISSFSFKSKSNSSNIGGVRLCIKVGDNWYASANVVPTSSYTESSIQVTFNANTWYTFDFASLSVGNIISDEISNSRINAIGILFNSISSGASANIANIKINI